MPFDDEPSEIPVELNEFPVGGEVGLDPGGEDARFDRGEKLRVVGGHEFAFP